MPVPAPLHEATTRFTYDADGNRVSIAYPSTQLIVDYTFDYAGRPLTASGAITSATYLPFGPLTELQFANNTTQKMQYDERYRIETNELRITGTTGNNGRIARYSYGYDGAGNVTSINDTEDSSYNRHFQYDDLHRLTKANTGSSLWVKGDYQWDAMGNIVRAQLTEVIPAGPEELTAGNPKKFKPSNRPKSKKDLLRAGIQPLGRLTEFAYSGTTPVISAVSLNDVSRTVQHDAAGNETSYAVTRTYSPRNFLANVSDNLNVEGDDIPHTVAYRYDGRGLRATRTELPANGPGTSARRYYVYTPELQLLSVTRDDAENVWEPDALPQPGIANNVHFEIIWFASRPVAQFNPGNFTRFTFTDHLGTPILQTDPSATIAWRVEFEPFGSAFEVRTGTRTDQPLRFPGQDLAMTWEGPEESYNIFRWYKAGWGRYTQADPIGVNGGVNLYIYVGGQPTSEVDPFGLFTIPINRKYAQCRTLRKGYAQQELNRVRQEPKCRSFFKNVCNADIDRLFADPLPRIYLVPESQSPSGGAFNTNTPDVIYISMRECKAMEDFSQTLIHELGHYSDYHYNQDSISDADHSDGCRAEIECFGFTRSLNCKAKGFQPYKPPKR